ncbi:MAG: lipoprotein signal peptidase [Chitinophagales bacterium]|nr:lipoprotein signal peptidase [Chitinophagales bacterium]
MKGYIATIIVISIILIDQASKIWVKTHMLLGQEYVIASWFRIHFTENPGMAFGMMLPGIWGKLFLSCFRLVAVTGGIWYLSRVVKEKAHWGFTLAVSMILAGAIGNMIDGTFYGVIFSDSYHSVAKIFPAEGGYSGWMQGLVVDMLWFPLFHGFFPEWVPFVGGDYFEFFRFIFNIADAAITVGVAIIIIFQKWFFANENEPERVAEPVSQPQP